MTRSDSLKVGLVQCLALIPGTSRSGATIIGAMVFGFSRKCATEFSFYLGIPTLMGAGAYSVWKERAALHAADLPMFAVGLVFAFFSALLCIRWLSATCRRTTSPRSPGTASCSAASCCSRRTLAGWSGKH